MRRIANAKRSHPISELRTAADVAAAYSRPGPHVTVVTAAPSAAERADVHLTRWHGLRHALVARSASERALGVLRVAVASLPPDGSWYVVSANETDAVWRRIDGERNEVIGGPATQRVAVGRAPRLVPALRDAQHGAFPVVGALVDRAGADLTVATAYGTTSPLAERLTIEGDREFIHRSAKGGWSQHRFQVRAEHVWELNGAAVAAEIGAMVDRSNAVGIVVSGDVRAAHFVIGHLNARHRTLARFVSVGGRHEPVSVARLGRELGRAGDAAADRVADRALARVDGAGVRRIDELGATAQALQVHDVEELVVRSAMPEHDWLDFVVRDALRNQIPTTVLRADDPRLPPTGASAIARSPRRHLAPVTTISAIASDGEPDQS